MSCSNGKGLGVGGNSSIAWLRPPPGMEGGGARSSVSWGNRAGGGGGVPSLNGHADKSVANTGEGNGQLWQIILRERFLHLILSMVGQSVTLMTNDGRTIEGILHTFTPFANLADEAMGNVYVVKASRTLNEEGKGDDGTAVIIEEGSTVVIPAHNVSSVTVKSMRLDSGMVVDALAGKVVDTLQTDSQISGGRGADNNLVAAGSAWTLTGSLNEALGGGAMSLSGDVPGTRGADTLNWRAAAARGGGQKPSATDGFKSSCGEGGLDGSVGEWDQFSANEMKFNVKASFDENLYTTKLDVSNIDVSRRVEAERIAREIESQMSINMHVAEERNQTFASDYDEEDRYSGVLTKDLKARPVVLASGVKSPVPGKSMNYAAAAQAAGKKGSTAESIAKSTATAAATTATAALSEDIDKAATSAADKLSPPPSLKSQQVKASLEERKFKSISTDVTSDFGGLDEKEAVIVDEMYTKMYQPEENDEKNAAAVTSSIKLNPNAKAFTFNPTAKTFTPTFAAPSPSPPIATVHQPMDAQMMPLHLGPVDFSGGSHMMGNMGQGGPQFVSLHGMMPMMNGQHHQTMQKYPSLYGQQPMLQPMPPVPTQRQGGGLPQPGHEDSASSVTGESSETAPPQQLQPLQQQQPQYTQQMGAYGVIPPGGYPGYHYGQSQSQAGRGVVLPGTLGGYLSPSVPGNLRHAQMQLLPPGANPYGAQRMYAPGPYQQHMMNPPQMGVSSLGTSAAANMMRGGPPPSYYGVGPGMGYAVGYSHHGGGKPDHNNNAYRDRNNSMQRGGGVSNFAGRVRQKGKGKNPGRLYQHQNSQSSQDSRYRQTNEASPSADGSGDGGGDAAGGSGSAEQGAPDVLSGAPLDRGAPKELGK